MRCFLEKASRGSCLLHTAQTRSLGFKQSVVRSLEYRSAARDALSGTKSQALVEAWNAQPMLAELPEPDRDG